MSLGKDLKKIVRSVINISGYDIVRLGCSNNTLEDLLGNIFRLHAIECVIDVGANTGQYGLSLRKLGYTGHIVSFEPVRSVFDQLKERSKSDKKWHCFNMAVGDRAEKKIINVYQSTVFSSFLEATDYAKNIWKSLEGVYEEEVTVVRLDDMTPEIQRLTGCDKYYLKLDTQGYDVNAFRGGAETIRSVVAMQTELSMIHVYNGMPDSIDVLKEFMAPGFGLAGMFPINRDPSLAVIEFDCVLVRRMATGA